MQARLPSVDWTTQLPASEVELHAFFQRVKNQARSAMRAAQAAVNGLDEDVDRVRSAVERTRQNPPARWQVLWLAEGIERRRKAQFDWVDSALADIERNLEHCRQSAQGWAQPYAPVFRLWRDRLIRHKAAYQAAQSELAELAGSLPTGAHRDPATGALVTDELRAAYASTVEDVLDRFSDAYAELARR